MHFLEEDVVVIGSVKGKGIAQLGCLQIQPRWMTSLVSIKDL